MRQRHHLVAFRHRCQTSPPRSETATSFAEVSERPFDHRATATQQAFAAFTADAAIVGAEGAALLDRLVGPSATLGNQRLRDVRAKARAEIADHRPCCVLEVAFVGHSLVAQRIACNLGDLASRESPCVFARRSSRPVTHLKPTTAFSTGCSMRVSAGP